MEKAVKIYVLDVVSEMPSGARLLVDDPAKIRLVSVPVGDIEIVETQFVGNIDYISINNAPIGVTEVDFVFVNAKTADKILTNILFRTDEGYVSEYNGIKEVFYRPNDVDMNVQNNELPEREAADINIRVVLTSENQADFTAGNIQVYAQYLPYPSYE
jgi:hypothetical protein